MDSDTVQQSVLVQYIIRLTFLKKSNKISGKTNISALVLSIFSVFKVVI